MKKKMCCFIAGSLTFAALLLLSACEFTITMNYQGISQKVYEVGDEGPAGGIIFYDKGYYSYHWRYLEAAPYGWYDGGEDPLFKWGGYNTPIEGTQTSIGSGKLNTERIVIELASGTYAAKICHDLVLGISVEGYKDWFLPSRDALELMYENLYMKDLGGLSTWVYWSSSEYDGDRAFVQSFYSGNQNVLDKSEEYRVRPVRAF